MPVPPYAYSSSEPPPTCERCGKQHYVLVPNNKREQVWRQTCTAHRTNGEPCRKWPIKGGRVCELHGGSAKHVRAKANERKEYVDHMRKITAGLTSAGIQVHDVDPIRELLWAVAVSANAVRWLGYKVAELTAPDVESRGEMANVEGVDEQGNPIETPAIAKLYGPDHNGDLRTHALWQEWNAERMRHAKFAKLAVDAGVSERMVRIAEAQAELVVEVITFALDELQMPAYMRERAGDIIAAKFREIETTAGTLGIGAVGT